jgi:hypothetical protein
VNRIYVGLIFYDLEKKLGNDFGNYSVSKGTIVSNTAFIPNDFFKDSNLKEKELSYVHTMLRSYFSNFESYEGQLTEVLPGNISSLAFEAGKEVFNDSKDKSSKSSKSGKSIGSHYGKSYKSSEILGKLFSANDGELMNYLHSRYLEEKSEKLSETVPDAISNSVSDAASVRFLRHSF